MLQSNLIDITGVSRTSKPIQKAPSACVEESILVVMHGGGFACLSPHPRLKDARADGCGQGVGSGAFQRPNVKRVHEPACLGCIASMYNIIA